MVANGLQASGRNEFFYIFGLHQKVTAVRRGFNFLAGNVPTVNITDFL
jgi:hypothetical protein